MHYYFYTALIIIFAVCDLPFSRRSVPAALYLALCAAGAALTVLAALFIREFSLAELII